MKIARLRDKEGKTSGLHLVPTNISDESLILNLLDYFNNTNISLRFVDKKTECGTEFNVTEPAVKA